MSRPVLGTQRPDLVVRIALVDLDVARELGEFRLQRFELSTALGAALDEDVLVEAGLHPQRSTCRAIEQPLRRWLGELGKQERLRRVVSVVIIARGSRAGPREGVDVRLAKTLPFERVRVAREVLLDDYELRLGPVSAEAVGSVDGLIAARLHHGRRRYKRSGIVSIPKVRGATSSS